MIHAVNFFISKRALLLSIIVLLISLSGFSAVAQQNQFYVDISKKEMATFNDAITMARLLYNERDDSSVFIDNVLWAASKKLFRVTIPINEEEINPVITRKEFSYWIWKIFNGKSGFTTRRRISRRGAYRFCVRLGIMAPGRGAGDTFTGLELLETFAYLDYYVRSRDLAPKAGGLELYTDDFENFPQWRRTIYRELAEQRAEEKQMRKDRRIKRANKRKARREAEKKKEENVEEQIEELIIEE
jgi:hypothetical protein